LSERRIREKVIVDNVQFGFRPGKGSTDAIFIVRQMHEKQQIKERGSYETFCPVLAKCTG